MSVRLTDTERKVAELYSKGIRPREIAERLGISINTVYKALSKARKAGDVVEEQLVASHFTFAMPLYSYAFQAQQHVEVNSRVVVVYEHDAVLKKLDEIISLLKAQRPDLKTQRMPETRGEGSRPREVKDVETPVNGDGRLPDVLKRNVWVGIIRSRTT
ncbi:MAG: helix-turn-helix transcriptional regulator [Pyrobaculum sp.]